jgi:hypothetical protein
MIEATRTRRKTVRDSIFELQYIPKYKKCEQKDQTRMTAMGKLLAKLLTNSKPSLLKTAFLLVFLSAVEGE